MPDVIVVGGGLFGSIATQALRNAGMDVTLLDDGRPWAGSRAAGCLMKPSWLSKMGLANQQAAFKLLDELYGLQDIDLWLGPTKVTAAWVSPDRVLGSPRETVEVKGVAPGHVITAQGQVLEAKTVIVACGYWTRELVPGAPVVGKVGVSLRLDKPPEDNRISVWAPYKQLVRFSQDGFHWAGDGTAILRRNWDAGREQQCKERIRGFAGSGVARVGIRPYVDTINPADLDQVRPGLWSLTGGGKNGTAAAGWAASRLLKALC